MENATKEKNVLPMTFNKFVAKEIHTAMDVPQASTILQ